MGIVILDVAIACAFAMSACQPQTVIVREEVTVEATTDPRLYGVPIVTPIADLRWSQTSDRVGTLWRVTDGPNTCYVSDTGLFCLRSQ